MLKQTRWATTSWLLTGKDQCQTTVNQLELFTFPHAEVLADATVGLLEDVTREEGGAQFDVENTEGLVSTGNLLIYRSLHSMKFQANTG